MLKCIRNPHSDIRDPCVVIPGHARSGEEFESSDVHPPSCGGVFLFGPLHCNHRVSVSWSIFSAMVFTLLCLLQVIRHGPQAQAAMCLMEKTHAFLDKFC